MRKLTIRNTSGSLAVSSEIVRNIAENATLEVEGVAGIASMLPEPHKTILRSKAPKDPVLVKMNEGVAFIRVAILVTADAKADIVAEKVQRNVKQAVQSMTGIAVTQVDVMIADVVLVEQ